MIVFIDDDRQVMAYYTHGTESKVWEQRGYTRQKIELAKDVEDIVKYGRDCYLTETGVVERVNPIQTRRL